jgi:hypothetical protein
MRRRLAICTLVGAFALTATTPAIAGWGGDFGPGGGAGQGTPKCHPPGQNADTPGCKGP